MCFHAFLSLSSLLYSPLSLYCEILKTQFFSSGNILLTLLSIFDLSLLWNMQHFTERFPAELLYQRNNRFTGAKRKIISVNILRTKMETYRSLEIWGKTHLCFIITSIPIRITCANFKALMDKININLFKKDNSCAAKTIISKMF